MLNILTQLAFNIGEELKIKDNLAIGDPLSGYQTLGGFISKILPNLYIVASLILFVLLIAGGFAIITSAGNPQKQQQGSKAFTSALVGFAIIIASFWILKIIEFITGISIFNTGF